MTLPRGSRGPAVVSLQRSLLALGYQLPRYGADGDLGGETLGALARCRGYAVRAGHRDAISAF